MTRKPLHEGQEVYFVSSRHHSKPVTITVLKVGRKWATLSNQYRADKDTWQIDSGGFGNRGTLWPDAEEYDIQTKVTKEYQRLPRDIGWGPKNGVSLEDIKSVRKLLRLDTNTEPSK